MKLFIISNIKYECNIVDSDQVKATFFDSMILDFINIQINEWL